VGIPEEDLRRLFKPFYQASNNPSRGGSGLGLMISRNLSELMGGNLTLTSVSGRGTEVKVIFDLKLLPKAIEQDTDISVAKDKSATALRVLVVDDYPANRMLLSQQLTFLGHLVVEAEDGAKGLEAWQTQPFDVVISDCSMPVMNGYEMVSSIRAAEISHNWSACHILGFTANALEDEKTRCRAAGMDGCMFKPVTIQNLSWHLNSVRAIEARGVINKKNADVMDISNLERLVVGNINAIKNLLSKLIASTIEDRSELNEVVVKGDYCELARVAHRIKGGARIIKAVQVEKCCEMLEESIGIGSAEEELEARVTDLCRAMVSLEDALKLYCNR
jgi:two-component system sensor histidine kinase EvgS